MVMALPIAPTLPQQSKTDCCTRGCEYSPDIVRWHLGRLLAYQRAGELAEIRYASQQLDRYGGTPNDGATAAIDVGRVVDQLRAEGTPITPEMVAARLCPWSSEACD